MRVLVVEDERKTASFVRKALQSEGFAVDVYATPVTYYLMIQMHQRFLRKHPDGGPAS